jgi:hypothetical protein
MLYLCNAFSIGTFTQALAVAERRPVIRILVYQKPSRLFNITHKVCIVKPACFCDIRYLYAFTHAKILKLPCFGSKVLFS